jgi:hypothetical protein
MHNFPSRVAISLAAAFCAFTQAVLPGCAHPVTGSRVQPPHVSVLPTQIGKTLTAPIVGPVSLPHSIVTTTKGLTLTNQSKTIYYLSATTNVSPRGSSGPGTVSVTTVPTTTTAATQEIENVINGDWSSWTGGSGKLTIAEVSNLLLNGSITGSQAAVLGMLAQQMYSDAGINTRSGPAYSQSQALAYLLGTVNSTGALFTNNGPYPGPSYFQSVMAQIASANPSNGVYSLYGTANGPIIATTQQPGIQQVEIGDCFFLSAVNSVLNQSPALIGSSSGGGMIQQIGTGNTFLVTFPNNPTPQKVTLTPSEIAAFSWTAPNNGCWLAVMGMAENAVLAKSPGSWVPSDLKTAPLGIISDGGFPAQTLGLLTGQPYTDYGRGLTGYSLSSVNAMLAKDLANNTPINIESKDHSLSITAFNATTDTVTILNPWGITGVYGASDDPGVMNPKMEVQMTNGVLQLSVSAMLSDFYSFGLESSLISSLATATNGNATGSHTGSFGAMYPGANLASLAPSSIVGNLPPTTSTPQLSAPALNSSLLNSSFIQSNFNQSAITQWMQTRGQSANSENTNGKSHSKAGFSPVAWATPSAPSCADIPVYDAGQGSMLVMDDHPVVVHTARADIQVAPHAAALVIQLGDEVAVINLCDQRFGDVSVQIASDRKAVALGKTLLLAPSTVTDSSTMQLAGAVEGRQSGRFGTFSDTNAFLGKASYLWALKSCPEFRELLHSTDPTQRAAAYKVLKAGAAFMALAQ